MKQEQHLLEAYERMLHRVRNWLERAKGQPLKDHFKHALEAAREKALELNELTKEEVDRVVSYVARDIHDAAEYLEKNKEELGSWLRFDMELVENRLLDAFAKAADPTTLDHVKLFQELERLAEYHTGEIVGLGTLRCRDCGKLLHFKRPGHIPPCPKCHATVFERAHGED
jgi:predicted Zn-ribbon and HTH transcriptional regulator